MVGKVLAGQGFAGLCSLTFGTAFGTINTWTAELECR